MSLYYCCQQPLTRSSQGQDVDLLLGLDMLKGHRACIDLEKNVLRIQGREIPFLSEHELPEKARDSYQGRRQHEAAAAGGKPQYLSATLFV